MEFENKEWEMSFGDLFRNALYKWKSIMALALVFAILLGGFQAWRTMQGNAKIPDEGEVAQYQSELRFWELQLANAEKMLENQEEYLVSSPLMQMDPDHAYVASAYLFVKMEYQIMPGMDYQNPDESSSILTIYQNVLSSAETLNSIAKQVEIAPNFLSGLIQIDKETTHLLCIQTYHKDPAVAEEILDLLLEHVEAAGENAAMQISDHTAEVMLKSVEACFDYSAIATKQEKQFKNLSTYQKDMTEIEDQIKTLKKSNPASSSKSVAKQGVIWAVVGAVLGAGLLAVLICVVFIFRTTVYSAEELKDRSKLQVLGSVAAKSAYRDPIIRVLRKAEGRAQPDLLRSAELIAENLQGYVSGEKQILVAGTVGVETIQRVTGALQEKGGDIKLIPSGNLLADAQAVRQLRQCDGVILLEACGKSRYKDIFRAAEYVESVGKQLVGCVVID